MAAVDGPGAGWATKYTDSCDCCPETHTISDAEFQNLLEALEAFPSFAEPYGDSQPGEASSSTSSALSCIQANALLTVEERARRKESKRRHKEIHSQRREESKKCILSRHALAQAVGNRAVRKKLGLVRGKAATESRAAKELPATLALSPKRALSARERAFRDANALSIQLLKKSPAYLASPSAARRAGTILLSHMAKARQRADMMLSPEEPVASGSSAQELAVWGYVKHKFSQRALLAFDSLRQLGPEARRHASYRPTPATVRAGGSNKRDERGIADIDRAFDAIWERLGATETIVSIGGGPGNDLYGVTLLHEHFFAHADVLRELVVLDFVAKAWAPVVELLAEEVERKISGKFICEHCDITLRLSDPSNRTAQIFLARAGLVIVSYILTETRGKVSPR